MEFKYKLLKAVDIAGLNFLRPVILLLYKEEPEEQWKKIGQQILVPLLAVAVFLGIWDILSKEIQTKSGKLPSPTGNNRGCGLNPNLCQAGGHERVRLLNEGENPSR